MTISDPGNKHDNFNAAYCPECGGILPGHVSADRPHHPLCQCDQARSAASEQRFTLREAERELVRRECLRRGHQFDVIQRMGYDGPELVICSRCGKSWKVEGSRE